MMRRVASTPSITGITRSIKITSGRSRAALSTASWPSAAIHTTAYPGTVVTRRRSVSRASARSFTIATRISSRFADEVRHGPKESIVVEAPLGQVAIDPQFKAAHPVLLPVFVRDNDDRQLAQRRIGSHQ